jgi:transcriptional regulator with XRE-family HTH domain
MLSADYVARARIGADVGGVARKSAAKSDERTGEESPSADPRIQAIGRRVRAELEGKGWNLNAFAQHTKIANSTFYAWINGEKWPDLNLLHRIAEALEVPLARFFVEADESYIEYEWTDTAAWLQLEESGRLLTFRAQGITDAQIQATRRYPFRGEPEARDYERILEAALLGTRRTTAAELDAATRDRAAQGKPQHDLKLKR